MQRERDLFDGAVKIADAAGFQLFGVFRIEHQIPFVFGQLLRSQGFLNQFFIDGERVDAPEIRDGVLVARVDFCHHGKQVGIDVGVVRDLAFVDFLIRTGFDLASNIGNGRGNQIVAGFAGQKLGF